jgi:hypothetical protein
MRRVHLEGAVVGPEVYRWCDAGDAALVDHLSSLGAADGELQIGILLPVSEEERELGKEAVVDIANQFDSGWARVAGDAALELRGARDKRFPLLEVVFILYLDARQKKSAARCGNTYDSAEELVDFTRSLFASVVNLGNTAASGGQHCVACQASFREWYLLIEGSSGAFARKRSVVVESLRHSYRGCKLRRSSRRKIHFRQRISVPSRTPA